MEGGLGTGQDPRASQGKSTRLSDAVLFKPEGVDYRGGGKRPCRNEEGTKNKEMTLKPEK